MELQRKGIDHCVQINGHMHNHWVQYPLPLDNVDKVDFDREYLPGTPAFHRFRFQAEETGDTFLDFSGWGKGCAFVNGFCLGRFWDAGPGEVLFLSQVRLTAEGDVAGGFALGLKEDDLVFPLVEQGGGEVQPFRPGRQRQRPLAHRLEAVPPAPGQPGPPGLREALGRGPER